MGGGLLGISKKNIFIFETRQKMVTKLGQITKLGPFSTFQLFKLSKLKIIYFFISLAHRRLEFIDRSILSKIDVSVYFQQKKSDKFSGPFSTFKFCTLFLFFNIQKRKFLL